MNNRKEINLDSYKYICSLIAELLELDGYTEEKITGYIESYGIDNFFKDYDKMELLNEVYEKLENLGLVLETLNDQGVNSESIGDGV